MRFRRNAEAEAELARDPAVVHELEQKALEARRKIELIAPSGPTGLYKRSIVVFRDGDAVAVGSTDFAAHLIEWGSVNNAPYAPIRRGVRAAGLDLHELPKS
jgi:hypothetical protein